MKIISSICGLVTIVAFVLFINWGWQAFNEQPLTDRPLRAHAWGISNEAGQQACGTLTMDSDTTGTFYRLGYDLPATNTYAGLSFTFNGPQPLTGYSALRIGVSFESPTDRCAVFLKRDETPDDQRQPTQQYFNMAPDRGYRDERVSFTARNGVDYITIPLSELTQNPSQDTFIEVGFQTGGTTTGMGSCRIHEVTLVRFGA